MYDIIGSTPFIDADYLPLTFLILNPTVSRSFPLPGTPVRGRGIFKNVPSPASSH